MQYKTIILAMLQQRPQMHEELRKERKLLAAMEKYARELKASHGAWMERLQETRPGSHPGQLSSEAMELAIKELEDRLPPASEPSDETLSLEAAVAFITRPTPNV